jgi:sigma-B regulation protein RsbU (phosphoserine phosphatase)
LPFWSTITAKLGALGLLPRTRLARFTAYLAGMEILLLGLKGIFTLAGKAAVANPLGGWTSALGSLLMLLLFLLALRWFRNHIMWSVRNRLIVTYLLIGVVPGVLVVLMALFSTYVLAGQFSSYLTLEEIEAQSRRLQAANSSSTAYVLSRSAAANLNSSESLAQDDSVFPGRTVSVLPQSQAPGWLRDGFHGLVVDQGRAYLRAANLVMAGRRPLAVISSAPVDHRLVTAIADRVGPVSFVTIPKNDQGTDNVNINFSGPVPLVNGKPAVGISAGVSQPQQNFWDREFSYYSLMQTSDWKSGAAGEPILLIGTMRPSVLYARLSNSTNKWSEAVAVAVGILAIAFAVIVLIAWLIGIRLTRTVTYSVANLYKATQRINSGDFTHRIHVREKDQLAALQSSFNSMTESLQRLIAEQKEKERLQSELEIAQEVQAQLFPQSVSSMRTLELHGVCRPARIVSGDYYDFLSDGRDLVGIAVGDISGKGISAALLMATIHSAVRAYEQEQLAPAGALRARAAGMHGASLAPTVVRPSPAQMLRLLNRHLYQTTQPEKYATLFLGFYEDETRRMTYSNAGHLPPVILGEDGSTRRLDTGGIVVGLFDELRYEEQTVELYPGDIFIAFSDGMTEPENEFGEFGEERLVETIAAHRHLPLERISEHAVAAVQDWIGSAEPPDDVTLVLARRNV